MFRLFNVQTDRLPVRLVVCTILTAIMALSIIQTGWLALCTTWIERLALCTIQTETVSRTGYVHYTDSALYIQTV